MSDFLELVDLAAEALGGTTLAASDEFFAPKENLLKAGDAQWIADKYTDRGKWMDGWETRRRRSPGHDWVIVRLGLPGIVRGIVVDTRHFRGNHPEACSIEVCSLAGTPSMDTLASDTIEWREVVPRTTLEPHTKNKLEVSFGGRVTHLRMNIYPDGGVARLRVHGEVVPDWVRTDFRGGMVDLAGLDNGGLVLAASDMFFGHRQNLIMPGPARNMSEGWETRRRRGPGHDWAIVKLGARGLVERIEVDTTYFIGNAPASCSVEVCTTERDVDYLTGSECQWRPLLPEVPLQPNTRHLFEAEVQNAGQATHARLNIMPDGGVARLRLWGTTAQSLSIRGGLNRLNRLEREHAEKEMLACCGSSAWAQGMVDARPFADVAALVRSADQVWTKLDKFDWLEAFAAHPRIGDKPAGEDRAAAWSRNEQSSIGEAAAGAQKDLADMNQAYYERFGHNFIISAAGMSAGEVLAGLRRRLQNEPSLEIKIAAEEQRKITRLRLGKLLRALSEGAAGG
jgi:allantoicase